MSVIPLSQSAYKVHLKKIINLKTRKLVSTTLRDFIQTLFYHGKKNSLAVCCFILHKKSFYASVHDQMLPPTSLHLWLTGRVAGLCVCC